MSRAPDPRIVCAFHNDNSVSFGATYISGLTASGHLRPVGDRLLMVQLTIHSGTEINSDMLRVIKPRELADAVRREAVALAKRDAAATAHNPHVRELLQQDVELDRSLKAIRRTGRLAARGPEGNRRGRGDVFYRQLAAEYVQLTIDGRAGRGVYKLLAERIGEPFSGDEPDKQRMRDWIKEAKARGFLRSRGQGQAGALPGERLLEQEGHA